MPPTIQGVWGLEVQASGGLGFLGSWDFTDLGFRGFRVYRFWVY